MSFFENIQLTPRLNRKLIIVISAVIVPLVVLEIWTMNRLATVGQNIAELENNKSHLELENSILRNKISEKKSLLETEKNSRTMGFEKISRVEFISNDQGLALSK